MDLSDRTVLVSGGASGLGAAVVRMADEAGARVGILDLDVARGRTLAESIGPTAAFEELDVTDSERVAEVVERVERKLGRIAAVVGCAGVSSAARVLGSDGRARPLDAFRRAVDVNLVGAFDLVRVGAAAIARNEPSAGGERGVIVNVGSIAGIEGPAGHTAYAASKGGLLALTLPLARDLAPWGIRVVSIAPGPIDTPMLSVLDDGQRDALVRQSAFPKRLGKPREFAALVRSCIENPMLNGEVIRLDGGTRLV